MTVNFYMVYTCTPCWTYFAFPTDRCAYRPTFSMPQAVAMCDANPISAYPLATSDASGALWSAVARCLYVAASHLASAGAPKFQVLIHLAATGLIAWINVRSVPYTRPLWNLLTSGKLGVAVALCGTTVLSHSLVILLVFRNSYKPP